MNKCRRPASPVLSLLPFAHALDLSVWQRLRIPSPEWQSTLRVCANAHFLQSLLGGQENNRPSAGQNWREFRNDLTTKTRH